jgi:hypothetical protein
MGKVNFKIIILMVAVFLFLLFTTSQSQVIKSSEPRHIAPGTSTPPPLAKQPLPDLVMTGYKFIPPNPTISDRVSLVIMIKNQGNAVAVIPVGATIWLATKPNGGGLGVESKGETINPGLSLSRSLQLFNAGELRPGTYKIKVVVDPENRVVKSGGTKNTHVIGLTVMDKQLPIPEGGWRKNNQQALNLLRELLKYNRSREFLTKVEAELESSGKTMNTAEQLLSKKPINRQVADPIVEDLSTRIKILENLMEEVKNKRQESQTAFENFDQKVNQLFNMLSNVLKSMKEMEQAIIRNMR